MDNATVNLNSAECIQSVTNWGSNTYQNICTGAHSVVPWGAVDYAVAIFISVFALTICLFIISFAFMIIKDLFKY